MSSQISPDCVGLALADDDAMALAHLGSYFSDIEDFTILTATCSLRVVLRFVQPHQVDVLITDVHMEHMDGAEMTREVLHLSPSARVILLTMVGTDKDLLQGLGVGASDLLLRNAPAEEITAVMYTVHSGVKVATPTSTTCLIDHVLTSVHGADGNIHPPQRERNVLHLLCEGTSNRKIASLLAITEATVKSRITGLSHKTGMVSRLKIAVQALERGHASDSLITIPAASVPSGSTSGSATS